jgi:long-chain-fatty-acid--[acyl-carrier-protein] ligase
MMAKLLVRLGQMLLRLRYRIRVTGIGPVAARGRRGILFLPNHPALIDPVIMMSVLHPRFAVRALSDQDQIDRLFIRWLAAQFHTIPVPDMLKHGPASRAAVTRAMDECIAALRRGENVLLYPAGRIYRRRLEDLRGNSAVEIVLQALPDVRVALVRTRGLWGSGFSRAAGRPPQVGAVLRKGALALLASGVFFAPRRRVTLEFHEPPDLPRGADRTALNRYLEAFYNRDSPPRTYVPYSVWDRRGVRTLPEPADAQWSGNVGDVPAATRLQVLQRLAEMSGQPPAAMQDSDQLAKDLGLDSLALVDLGLWLETEFGFAVADAPALNTVGDVLLAACGLVTTSGAAEPLPVPPTWLAAPAGAAVTTIEGNTLTGAFLRQARLTPDRVIVADHSGGRTYRDLMLGILALKPALQRLPGDYLGIMLPATAGTCVATLAAMFAGKIPVMVNWTVGLRNMTHALELLGVTRVLTADALVKRLEEQIPGLAEVKSRFLLLEDVRAGLSWRAKLGAKIRSRCCWRSLTRAPCAATAVVLFTSGSESLPKAVPLTHANLLANMRDVLGGVRFRPHDRMLGMLPPFHSFGINCTTLLPVCAGVPVVFHPNPTQGGLLARMIEAYRVTLLIGTPTFLNNIVRAARDPQLATLRMVVSGAEKCPAHLYDTVAQRWPGMQVLEGYGVTECSPVISVNDPDRPRRGTIGKVLPSVKYARLDVETGRRAAPAQPGLLLVRGPSVFEGYLNYDGPSPFVDFENERWYSTGDLVTEDADGILTFAGRLKRFVKLGGEMISLPAIEEVLARAYTQPEDEGPVLAVESTPHELNPELVLFTIREVDRGEVNRRIREAGLSPLHNIRIVRKVDAIPVLGTGKTDNRRLKESLKVSP